jgi:hypothetical protein
MKKLISIVIAMMGFLATSSAQEMTVEAFVNGLLDQYPKARLLDIYKSCFQDYMGAEHLVSDTASVRAYLERELNQTNVEDLMPWYCEPCGMNGNYVRVSLRAVIEDKIGAEQLLEAFIASANSGERPSVERWAERWHEIIAFIDRMDLSLPCYEQDKRFIEEVLANGQYAISHSPEYREAYAPHYRIVKRDILEKLGLLNF